MADVSAAEPNKVVEAVDRQFEAYKLEYQIAVDRYENIYKAIWQHFSYMAALAAGIVAFGSKVASPHVVALVAGSPLLFWFYASYLPMDHYARSARRRASEVEGFINKLVFNIATEAVPSPPLVKLRLSFTILVAICTLCVVAASSLISLLGVIITIMLAAVLVLGALSVITTPPKPNTRFRKYITVYKWFVTVPAADGDSPTCLSSGGTSQDEQRDGLRHFRGFGQDDPAVHWGRARGPSYLHVNQVVTGCFVVFTFAWIALLPPTYLTVRSLKPTVALPSPAADLIFIQESNPLSASGGVRLQVIDQQLLETQRQLRAIDSLIRARQDACSSQRKAGPC